MDLFFTTSALFILGIDIWIRDTCDYDLWHRGRRLAMKRISRGDNNIVEIETTLGAISSKILLYISQIIKVINILILGLFLFLLKKFSKA